MTHHIFIPDYQFQKYFYCFCRVPLVVEALCNCPVCPPLNLALKSNKPEVEIWLTVSI